MQAGNNTYPNATTNEQVNQEVDTTLEQNVEQTTVQQEPQREELKPLTPEQYRALAREEAMKIAQSQVAKGENRMKEFIQSEFKKLDDLKDRLNLSPEQDKAIRDGIVRDALTKDFDEPANTQEQQRQTNQEQTQDQYSDEAGIDIVTSEIQKVFNMVGTNLDENDKEFATVAKAIDDLFGVNRNNPKALEGVLKIVHQAAMSKSKRVAALNGTTNARTVGVGGATTGKASMSTADIKAEVRNRRATGQKV